MSIYGKPSDFVKKSDDQVENTKDSKSTNSNSKNKVKTIENVYTESGELIGYYLEDGTIRLLDGTIIPSEVLEVE